MSRLPSNNQSFPLRDVHSRERQAFRRLTVARADFGQLRLKGVKPFEVVFGAACRKQGAELGDLGLELASALFGAFASSSASCARRDAPMAAHVLMATALPSATLVAVPFAAMPATPFAAAPRTPFAPSPPITPPTVVAAVAAAEPAAAAAAPAAEPMAAPVEAIPLMRAGIPSKKNMVFFPLLSVSCPACPQDRPGGAGRETVSQIHAPGWE